ncbi:MAG TPA: MFS transporter [Longimicrobiales bacterium]|nr:MFS transporter [Longimicrobiales bacterium]
MARAPLLDRVGLTRPELRAWAMYDWAKSSFETTVGVAVLPVYWSSVAAVTLAGPIASAYWGYTNSIALILVAIMSPVLGAMADFMGAKKKFLAGFMLVGVLATACLFFVGEGDWKLAAFLFVVGSIGVTASTVFNDSLLPNIASDDEVDKVSTAGYALGYFGGGVLLALNVVMLTRPSLIGLGDVGTATRVVFLTVSVWWLVFSLPVLRRVPEPPRRLEANELATANPVAIGFRRLAITFREIRQYRELFKFLLAYWLYIDGVHTIQKMAAVYGVELGIGRSTLIGAILLVQFVGIPATFAFGSIATRIGARKGLYIALGVYTGIAIFGYFVSEAWHFWVLAIVVGLVQGGAQALSRSLYATMVPRAKSSEFFSFFSIFEKFGGVAGPALFGVVALMTGSSRYAILALIFFFVGGIALLSRVDIDDGRRAARADDASTRLAGVDA